MLALLNNTRTFVPAFIEEQFKTPPLPKNPITLHQMGLKISVGSKTNTPPVVMNNVTIIFYGFIFNLFELCYYINRSTTDTTNEELIIHLYRQYGIEQTLQMIDGTFTFLLLDNKPQSNEYVLYIVRDSYGMEPLFVMHPTSCPDDSFEMEPIIAFSTELSLLNGFYKKLQISDSDKKKKKKKTAFTEYTVQPFSPGTYSTYTFQTNSFSNWMSTHNKTYSPNYIRYSYLSFNSIMYSSTPQYSESEIVLNLQRYLIRSTQKWCSHIYSKKPIPTCAVALSGGISSSIVCGLIQQYHITNGLPPLKTYSVAYENDADHLSDPYYWKLVANYLKTDHTEHLITESEYEDLLPEVMSIWQSPEKEYMRAAVSEFWLGKKMAEDGIQYMINGNGAHELFGGFINEFPIQDCIEFDKECREQIGNHYLHEGLQTNQLIRYWNIIPYSPFLDRSLVQYYFTVPPQIRAIMSVDNDIACEKYWLRIAFSHDYYRNSCDESMLPDEVLWRALSYKKEYDFEEEDALEVDP